MSNWSFGSILLALLLAILVPALIVHLSLGRKGGHHLFKDVPKDKVKDLPFEMARFDAGNELKGAIATFVGLAVALVLYPLACKLGLPLNVFGLSDKQLVFTVALGVGLLIVFGFTVVSRRRNK